MSDNQRYEFFESIYDIDLNKLTKQIYQGQCVLVAYSSMRILSTFLRNLYSKQNELNFSKLKFNRTQMEVVCEESKGSIKFISDGNLEKSRGRKFDYIYAHHLFYYDQIEFLMSRLSPQERFAND